MATLRKVNLTGKVRDVGSIRFLWVETGEGAASPFATVFFAREGEPSAFGLRLDISKRAFLDVTDDAQADAQLDQVAAAVVDALGQPRVVRFGPAPMHVDLISPCEFGGVFWTPENDTVQVQGILTYDRKDGVRLKLAGVLGSLTRTNPIEMGRFETVLARLEDGSTATLLNVFVTNQSFNSDGPKSSKLFANRCIFGVHLMESTSRQFARTEIRLTSLERWFAASGFKSLPFDTDQMSLVYRCEWRSPESVTIDISSAKMRATVGTGLSQTGEWEGSLTLKETAHLTVYSELDLSLDEWLSAIFKLQGLFSLMYGEPCGPTEISLFSRNHEGFSVSNGRCPILVMTDPNDPNRNAFSPEMLLRCEDVQAYPHLFDAWFELSERLPRVVGLYFGLMNRGKIAPDLKFLSAVTALEALGKGLEDGDFIAPRILDRILRFVDESAASELNEAQISSLKSRVLQARESPLILLLDRLLSALPETLRGLLIGPDARFTERVVLTRHFLTHGVKSPTDDVFDGSALYYAAERLQIWLTCFLLSELGIPFQTIEAAFGRRSSVNWILGGNGT